MMNALMGGAIIGLAVSIMLLFNGRVTGISGILAGVVRPKKGDTAWRALFVLGLVVGGFVVKSTYPQAFQMQSHTQLIDYAFAGLLVGFGTLLGNGCTSGHGVCGISRFSMRSLLATITFITFGVLSVLVYKTLRGGL